MKSIKLMMCVLLVTVLSFGMRTTKVYAEELTTTENSQPTVTSNVEEDTQLEEVIDTDTNVDTADASDIDEDLIEDITDEEDETEEDSEEADKE